MGIKCNVRPTHLTNNVCTMISLESIHFFCMTFPDGDSFTYLSIAQRPSDRQQRVYDIG